MSCMCLCFRNEMSIQVYQLLKLCHEKSVAFETAFIQVTTYHLMGNAFMSFELLSNTGNTGPETEMLEQ